MAMRKLAIMKFGGSLINIDDLGIDSIFPLIQQAKRKYDIGPIVVFSAPMGYTDKLIEAGRVQALSRNADLKILFEPYRTLANKFVKRKYLKELLKELDIYYQEMLETFNRVNKRFEGNNKARLLTSGGELPTSAIMDYIFRSKGLKSCHLTKDRWPIVTDDDYENATPNFEESIAKVDVLINLLEEGKIISHAGFLGMTFDGLETMLGRGGSDLTAVFTACLLKDKYDIDLILYKETPVLSADPKIVPRRNLKNISSMTYNEAIKASVSGMKIVQSAALRLARTYNLPIKVIPINNPEMTTIIQTEDTPGEILKCVTGKKYCAILTMDNLKSKSLEDSLKYWEGYEDFIDLGTEVLETGKTVRDFFIFDASLVRKQEERLRKFDRDMNIEYGVGIVTLVGDKMKNSPGVASMAIGAIPNINIKRAVFAPHTSQIILLLNDKDVETAVKAIHSKRDQINQIQTGSETT